MEKPQIKQLLKRLEKRYGNNGTALVYGTPHEMLVATILSAQCTDERVNKVTAKLFKKYRSVRDFAEAPRDQLEQDIRSTGFFRNKARNIIGASKRIMDVYRGEVPEKMTDLLTLPGVARKTANVVLQNAFGKVEGVVVDTHVGRLSKRLGLSPNKSPEKIEVDLMDAIPRRDWGNISYWLIDHGRAVCKARKPACEQCFLKDICPKII